jgi:hypothetical protein
MVAKLTSDSDAKAFYAERRGCCRCCWFCCRHFLSSSLLPVVVHLFHTPHHPYTPTSSPPTSSPSTPCNFGHESVSRSRRTREYGSRFEHSVSSTRCGCLSYMCCVGCGVCVWVWVSGNRIKKGAGGDTPFLHVHDDARTLLTSIKIPPNIPIPSPQTHGFALISHLSASRGTSDIFSV